MPRTIRKSALALVTLHSSGAPTARDGVETHAMKVIIEPASAEKTPQVIRDLGYPMGISGVIDQHTLIPTC